MTTYEEPRGFSPFDVVGPDDLEGSDDTRRFALEPGAILATAGEPAAVDEITAFAVPARTLWSMAR